MHPTTCIFCAAAMCQTNAEYVVGATSCPASCSHPGAPGRCDTPPVSGCICRQGYLQGAKKCVRPEMCGCVVNEEYHVVCAAS